MNEAVCRARLIKEVIMESKWVIFILERASSPAGKLTGSHTEHTQLHRFQVQDSSESTSSEVPEPQSDTNSVQLVTDYQKGAGHASMQDTYTKRSMAENLAMSDSKNLSHILIQIIRKPTALKKFSLRALFLLRTVLVWKSCWGVEPYDHQKVLCSLFI